VTASIRTPSVTPSCILWSKGITQALAQEQKRPNYLADHGLQAMMEPVWTKVIANS
jgi:hypothetical protein